MLVGDVVNVFQIGCRRDDLHRATAILFIKAFPRHFGDTELDRFLETVDSAVHLREPTSLRSFVVRAVIACRSIDIPHVKRLARRGRQRKRGKVLTSVGADGSTKLRADRGTKQTLAPSQG
jgi:hypothetical protein